ADPWLVKVRDIQISWQQAWEQFIESEQPKYVGLTQRALPNFEELSPDCRGALVSLVFNRGPSFGIEGDRYSEMRNIRAHMKAKKFYAISSEIRSMSRIWKDDANLRGLVKRRELEAALFQAGLS